MRCSRDKILHDLHLEDPLYYRHPKKKKKKRKEYCTIYTMLYGYLYVLVEIIVVFGLNYCDYGLEKKGRLLSLILKKNLDPFSGRWVRVCP